MSVFRWGTVTANSPLRVKLDGDTAALPITPDSLVDPLSLSVGGRVRCEFSARRVIVVGRAGGAGLATVAYTTSSLANGASETTNLDLGAAFTLVHVTTAFACRVRAYQSSAYRTADASRDVGNYPSGDHGLIFEDDGAAAAAYSCVIPCVLADGVTATPFSFTNRSGATRAITVTLEVRK